MHKSQEYAAGITPPVYEFLVFVSFLNQARFLLVAVMILINIAFLLQKITPVNRFQEFWARQQRFQPLLGVLLLFLLIAPTLVAQAKIYFLSNH